MKKVTLIKVPLDSRDHYVNNCGCLRFEVGKFESSVIEPNESGIYLYKDVNKIIGESVFKNEKYIVVDGVEE